MSEYNKFIYNQINNSLLNNKDFITRLISNIRLKLERNLIKSEKIYIINYLKKINPVIFKDQEYGDIIKALSSHIVEEINKFNCNQIDQVNIHEMLKAEIGIASNEPIFTINNKDDSKKNIPTKVDNIITNNNFDSKVDVISLFGKTSIEDIQKTIDSNFSKTYSYIMLDTRYRILDDDGTTRFRWNFVNNETIAQGSVNAIGNIQNITALRVSPIRIPYSSIADNNYDRVTLFIEEFSAQSFIGQENTRFHFIFNANVNDRWIDLDPFNFNDGYFRFRSPITRLETLTIRFNAPLENIIFDRDRLNGIITTYGVKTEFTTSSNHNLETGDLIYISGFTTSRPASDTSIISNINKTNGHTITSTALNKFMIDVNSTSVNANGTGTIFITNGTPTVNGVGTLFNSLFNVGDNIIINGNVYTILSITSNTLLTLTSNYTQTTINAPGIAFSKYNEIVGLLNNIYFGSKRIFIPLEIEYYKTTNSGQ
jgi:hypothetical protein